MVRENAGAPERAELANNVGVKARYVSEAAASAASLLKCSFGSAATRPPASRAKR